MKPPRRWKFWDYFALFLSVFLTVGAVALAWGQSGGEARVEIQGFEGRAVYPLNRDLTLEIPGPLGKTEVQIRNGEVWVDDSPCTNKLCIAMGRIHRAGEWVACLPNRVFVRITGGQGDGVDALSF